MLVRSRLEAWCTALAPVYLALRSRADAFTSSPTRRRARCSRGAGLRHGNSRRQESTSLSSPTAWRHRWMRGGAVDLVIVGADRIAANGDVGEQDRQRMPTLAIAARHHDIPFYVAAPMSTVDLADSQGLRHRDRASQDSEEMRRMERRTSVMPPAASVYNPAFDVTPAALITAIITDEGIVRGRHTRSSPEEKLGRRGRVETRCPARPPLSARASLARSTRTAICSQSVVALHQCAGSGADRLDQPARLGRCSSVRRPDRSKWAVDSVPSAGRAGKTLFQWLALAGLDEPTAS